MDLTGASVFKEKEWRKEHLQFGGATIEEEITTILGVKSSDDRGRAPTEGEAVLTKRRKS